MRIIAISIGILLLGVVLFMIDGMASRAEPFDGKVVDKHYKERRTSIGSGSGFTSNGDFVFLSTSEVDPEAFLVMVRTESGSIVTVKCSPEVYYAKEVGDPIKCEAHTGLFTGAVWSMYGIQ